jgi:hypothetical protein
VVRAAPDSTIQEATKEGIIDILNEKTRFCVQKICKSLRQKKDIE